jgi:hypothetical protein
MQVRDMEHNTVQIFQAEAPTFNLIGPPVSDDELHSLVETGDSGSVIRIAIVSPLEQQLYLPPLAPVETSSTKFNLPLQEPSSPHSSTGYDASDEELGSGGEIRRGKHTAVCN